METWENLIEETQQCASGAEEDPGEEVCGVGNGQWERPIASSGIQKRKTSVEDADTGQGRSLCQSPGVSFCAPPENPSPSQH